MKFRRKALVVEAQQFWINDEPWPEGVVENPSYWENTGRSKWRNFRMKTSKGWTTVRDGDWIIIDGEERYPEHPAIFNRTYDFMEK